ncbi:MAG: cytochrome c oxidase subunit II [Candidatus Eremiobacteraeota bacterium]|nr:cytochrome c oxidase subunit II [Candidatus Eremiobacteraeota bacterium]
MRNVRFVATTALLLPLAGCGVYGLPNGATQQAQTMHLDWVVFSDAGLVVAVLLFALIIAPLILWRRRSDAYPPQFNRNNRWEIAYTGIPLLMVIGLFAFTFWDEEIVERITAHPANTVDVVGFQWSWRFHYHNTNIDVVGTPQSPPQLVLPVDETTRIDLTSSDVNHAFWIPAFLFKRDAIAGISNHFDLQPTRLGVYRGVCAEFCGLDHALMSFTVRVVSRGDFARWLRNGGSSAILSAKGASL